MSLNHFRKIQHDRFEMIFFSKWSTVTPASHAKSQGHPNASYLRFMSKSICIQLYEYDLQLNCNYNLSLAIHALKTQVK
jgi:hypothetical protein